MQIITEKTTKNTNPVKNIKIILKNGDTIQDINKIIETTQYSQICFLINRNFKFITEVDFINTLKETVQKSAENKCKIQFYTDKNYFKEILIQANLDVLEEYPNGENYGGTKSLSDFASTTVATKNKDFQKKENTQKPKSEDEKTNSKTSKTVEETKSNIKKAAGFASHKIENLDDKKSLRGIFFFLILLLLGLLIFVFFWISPKAKIVVKPQLKVTPIIQNIVIKLPQSDINDQNKNIPTVGGIYIETEIEDTLTYPASEKKYNLTNAKGKVTIYNNTDEPKFFIPSRLSTDNHLIFRTTKNITVPPRVGDKPGELVVEIIADKFTGKGSPIGGKGNIIAGTELFFPGLRKETRELYYAKANKGPLTGGSTLTRYFIAENDFELVTPLLQDSLKVRAIQALETELEKRSLREDKKYILLNQQNLLRSELIESNFPEDQIGQEQQTFEVYGKLKLSGIVFDQDLVITEIRKKMQEVMDHRKKLLKIDQKSIQYRILEQNDLEENGWIKLSISLFGVETLDMQADNNFAKKWQEELKQEISGKTKNKARGILINRSEIDDVIEISISPFWVDKIPHFLDKIKFEVQHK